MGSEQDVGSKPPELSSSANHGSKECYVFVPNGARTSNDKDSKRGKSDRRRPSPRISSLPTACLLKGFESQQSLALRFELYERLWRPKEVVLNAFLHEADLTVSDAIGKFLVQYDIMKMTENLPVALLVTGPGNALPPGLLSSAMQKLEENVSELNLSIELSASQGPSVKSILRSLNELAAKLPETLKDFNANVKSQGNRHLSYDLEGLHSLVTTFNIRRVVVLFHEAETFDSHLLLELIQLFNVWKDRIPFIILYGIGTSAELFQSKLPNRAIHAIESQVFPIAITNTEELFIAMQQSHFSSGASGSPALNLKPRTCLWLGPNISKRILDRQKETLQRPSALVGAFKYTYMAHFFANPLAIWLDENITSSSHSHAHLSAIRCLPSFQRYCEKRLAAGDNAVVRRLLDDDLFLKDSFEQNLKLCSDALHENLSIVSWLFSLQAKSVQEPRTWSEVYQLAMSGQLLDSIFLEELSLSIRKSPSNMLVELLNEISSMERVPALPASIRTARDALLQHLSDSGMRNLRSGHDIQQLSLRTTVVAQKVELSQHTATLTEAEVNYTSLLDDFHDALKDHVSQNVRDPQQMFPIEVLMYDLPSTYRDVFNPQPRFAVERGLSRPHDYLGSECCGVNDDTILTHRPAISILYRMYLESGDLLNIADLWSAFSQYVAKTSNEDAGHTDELAHFEACLAELKFLGFVHQSKRRFDHVAKLAWNGL